MWFATFKRRNGSEIRSEDHALEMVFTRQKSRVGANPESLPRTQPVKIYMKYALPVGKSSHRDRMNYLFKELFNTLRNSRFMNCIIVFLILMSLQQRMI